MPGPGADAPNVWATSHAIYAIWAGCMGLFAIADVVVICSFWRAARGLPGRGVPPGGLPGGFEPWCQPQVACTLAENLLISVLPVLSGVSPAVILDWVPDAKSLPAVLKSATALV